MPKPLPGSVYIVGTGDREEDDHPTNEAIFSSLQLAKDWIKLEYDTTVWTIAKGTWQGWVNKSIYVRITKMVLDEELSRQV